MYTAHVHFFYEFRPFLYRLTRALSIEKYGIYVQTKQTSEQQTAELS